MITTVYNPQQHTVSLYGLDEYHHEPVGPLTVDECKALHTALERAIKESFEHDRLCHPVFTTESAV